MTNFAASGDKNCHSVDKNGRFNGLLLAEMQRKQADWGWHGNC
jgi:hypothetical protein